MIGLMLAMIVQGASAIHQDPPAVDHDLPTLTAADACVVLEGRGRAVLDGRRLSGRALARAVAERLPSGRPIFISFANERASSDTEGITAVLVGAASASEIVLLETCDLPAGDNTQ